MIKNVLNRLSSNGFQKKLKGRTGKEPLIFISGNSVLHGLIPVSNQFTSKFLQNRVCPLSFSEFIIKGKIVSSSGLSSL